MDAHGQAVTPNLPVVVRPGPHPASSRLGISARLGIAFFAVAVLAAAANFIGEYGSSIVYTVPAEPAPLVVAAVRPPQAPIPQPPPVIEPRSVEASGLIVALDRFARAVEDRSTASSPEGFAALRAGTEDLTRQMRAYEQAAVGVVSPAKLNKLRARVNANAQRGHELVQLADERRKTLKEYLERFETMDVRMKTSLDRAFKIFGRVIARQSLVDLSSSLDEMRHRLTALTSTEHYDSAAVTAIAASEAAFGAKLQQTERGLVRSQGQEWVARMRTDFARIVTLRELLLSLDNKQSGELAAFSRETVSLAALARTTAASRIVNAEAVPVAAAVRPVPAGQAPLVLPPALDAVASAPVVKSASRISTVTKPSQQELRRRALVAWITAGVLVLVLVTSVVTVVSIVGPVRRFMRVTRSIANGRTNVRVPRGGLKELDLLAVAFNQMAEQLSAAQAIAKQYQGQLEEKVEERTRQLQHLAQHDPLTQLPNRRQLFAFLHAALERAAARGRCVGVLFLDVDNFKNINDSLGHAFGDHVLQGIAQRLRETTGACGFAARLGGDEFTVVLEDASNGEEVLALGQALLHAFQKPLLVEGRDLAISASLGVSLYPEHESDANALLRAADAALFHAKALGRNQLTLFTRDLLEAASARFTIEQGLRRAIERGEFELVFQPEIELATLQPALVEALLRWRQPDGRLAMPGEFLQIAEDSGLIMEISDWVLRAAIAAAAHWYHGAWPQARVAINVSPRQLFDNQFVGRVQQLLSEYRLPAQCIEIELTETVLQTGRSTIEALRCLLNHGVAIALDDFGAGYSSIASLEQLPLTRVKLDRSLIADIDTSERSAAIARSIISLCRGLGLQITAEGVERPEQLAMLREYPLSVQGYLLTRPVAVEDLPAVLNALPAHVESLLLSLPGVPSRRDDPRPAVTRRASAG